MDTIILGGGCFWCIEAGYKLINGVESVVSGYAGGTEQDANYHRVGTGTTGHAEVVSVTFNQQIISLPDILDIFWVLHNPTTPNQQGNDIGPQYRSIILYTNDIQKEIAERSIAQAQELWNEPIVTELVPLEKFYPAEDYHQNYFESNPGNGYCQVIINPKLDKLRKKFAERIKA